MLIGIVGKPSSGKSTFFRALTLAPAEIAEHPFTTIKPNRGIGYIKIRCPCQEFKVKCNPNNSICLDGWRFVPVEILDVAGLIPGAHEGKGLGNQFLDDLRRADVLIQIVDISGTTDNEGRKTKGHNPLEEIEFLREEINVWFYNIIKRHWNSLVQKCKHGNMNFKQELLEILSGLGIKEEHLLNFDLSDFDKWGDNKIKDFSCKLREISKPIVLVANKIDLSSSEENLNKVKQKYPDIIPCFAAGELALREGVEKGFLKYIPGENNFEIVKELNEKQKQGLELIRRVMNKWNGTGVQQVINKAFNGVIVFPVENENKLTNNKGQVLPDAIILEKNSTALDLAYKIHEDIGKNFVKALNCKTKKPLGKDYILQMGDVIKIFTK